MSEEVLFCNGCGEAADGEVQDWCTNYDRYLCCECEEKALHSGKVEEKLQEKRVERFCKRM